MRSRTRWRSRLFTRLRVTAGPTDRATTKPIRRSCSPSTRARWTTSSGPPARRPRRTTVANPAASVRRWPRGSTPNRLIRRLRRPGGCDPCDGARRGCCARHGCASAGGSRASCDDAGCSAGTYACSRGLRSWSGQAQRFVGLRRIGACPRGMKQPIDAGPTAPPAGGGAEFDPHLALRVPLCGRTGVDRLLDPRGHAPIRRTDKPLSLPRP